MIFLHSLLYSTLTRIRHEKSPHFTLLLLYPNCFIEKRKKYSTGLFGAVSLIVGIDASAIILTIHAKFRCDAIAFDVAICFFEITDKVLGVWELVGKLHPNVIEYF